MEHDDSRPERELELPGCIKQTGLANIAAQARKIFATIRRSPATAWMADMPNISLRLKILSMWLRRDFPMNRPRRCFVRESSDSGRYGALESKWERAWAFMVSVQRRTWRCK